MPVGCLTAAYNAGMSADNWDVIVVGAGAAGLMAGLRAAESGRRTLVLEKGRKPGVKILMSGGTRCKHCTGLLHPARLAVHRGSSELP
jgi:predicted flavoprotein YhiN